MTRLRELITESKFLKREFGEPLPTFNGVMEKYKVNKLKEDWWSNMSAKQQAAYVKAHPKSKQAQDAKDKEKGMDRARDLAKKGMEKGSEPEDKPFGGDTGKDADYEPSHPDDMDDRDVFQFLNKDEPEDEEPKEKRPGGKQAEKDYQKADQMMMKYAGVDIEKAEYWAKKKREASDKMMGRTGKELGEDKMDESVKMYAISGNKRFMTKTAIPILKKYGIKNIKAHNIGGYFLELRFPIDSRKLKDLDKELKRKNKRAYGRKSSY